MPPFSLCLRSCLPALQAQGGSVEACGPRAGCAAAAQHRQHVPALPHHGPVRVRGQAVGDKPGKVLEQAESTVPQMRPGEQTGAAWQHIACSTGSSVPAQCQLSTTSMPAQYRLDASSSTSSMPAQCQLNASPRTTSMPAQYQLNASSVPAQCQLSACSVPAQCQLRDSAVVFSGDCAFPHSCVVARGVAIPVRFVRAAHPRRQQIPRQSEPPLQSLVRHLKKLSTPIKNDLIKNWVHPIFYEVPCQRPLTRPLCSFVLFVQISSVYVHPAPPPKFTASSCAWHLSPAYVSDSDQGLKSVSAASVLGYRYLSAFNGALK